MSLTATAERLSEHAREAARLLDAEPVDLRAVNLELQALEADVATLRGAAMVAVVERRAPR
jgi:hypothetical protein